MKKLKADNRKGIGAKVTAYVLEYPAGHLEIGDGITKKEFLAILDKASRPIKREPESDSEKFVT